MHRPKTKADLRLTRFAWMAALVVVLRFVAWDLHHALDAHDTQVEEACELCLVFERGGDCGNANAAPGRPPAAPAGPGHESPSSGHALLAPCPPPRGPPVRLT